MHPTSINDNTFFGSENRVRSSASSVVERRTDTLLAAPPLRRTNSLPSMSTSNHEAEVLYNRMRGIKSILKCSIHDQDNGSICSTIDTRKSIKESSGASTRRVNKMKSSTIEECTNDDDRNRTDSDDDPNDDHVFVRRSIEFLNVEIREYARTVGDNPSCSSGAPIAIDWFYDPNVKIVTLDEYEDERPPRRSAYEMVISRTERHRMLSKEWNVPQSQMAAAIRSVFRIKSQRRVTFSRFGSAEKFEEIMEQARRKLKKIFLGQSVSGRVALLEKKFQEAQTARLQLWKEELSQRGSAELYQTSVNVYRPSGKKRLSSSVSADGYCPPRSNSANNLQPSGSKEGFPNNSLNAGRKSESFENENSEPSRKTTKMKKRSPDTRPKRDEPTFEEMTTIPDKLLPPAAAAISEDLPRGSLREQDLVKRVSKVSQRWDDKIELVQKHAIGQLSSSSVPESAILTLTQKNVERVRKQYDLQPTKPTIFVPQIMEPEDNFAEL